MNIFIINVGSVTKAQLAQRVLSENGIHSRITRSKSFRKGNGCGYSLLVEGNREKIIHILRAADIHILSIGEENDIP